MASLELLRFRLAETELSIKRAQSRFSMLTKQLDDLTVEAVMLRAEIKEVENDPRKETTVLDIQPKLDTRRKMASKRNPPTDTA